MQPPERVPGARIEPKSGWSTAKKPRLRERKLRKSRLKKKARKVNVTQITPEPALIPTHPTMTAKVAAATGRTTRARSPSSVKTITAWTRTVIASAVSRTRCAADTAAAQEGHSQCQMLGLSRQESAWLISRQVLPRFPSCASRGKGTVGRASGVERASAVRYPPIWWKRNHGTSRVTCACGRLARILVRETDAYCC
jgi:hypothetical protein